jgi:hypothetical protein
MPSAGKVMLTVFWGSQGVPLAHFQECGENVNSATCCEVLLKLQENVQANWQEMYCFIITMPDSIEPKEPVREFKYSENFLNICLTAQTWPLVTFI